MESMIYVPDMAQTLQIRGFHFRVVEAQWSYHDHYHHSFELLHCVSGRVTEWLEDKPVLFQTGDWLLIPPGIKHRTLNNGTDRFSYISLLFDIDDPDFRQELKQLSQSLVTWNEAAESGLPSALAQLDSALQQLQLRKRDTPQKIPIGIKLDLQAGILLILKHVIALLQKNRQAAAGSKTAHAHEIDTANRLEQLIQDSITDPELSVQNLSLLLGMSRSQCTKLFTKVFGLSPRQYITSRRLLLAKKYLTESSLTIEAIAEQLGFSSLSHFSRQFKRWTGLSPNQYRPKHALRALQHLADPHERISLKE